MFDSFPLLLALVAIRWFDYVSILAVTNDYSPTGFLQPKFIVLHFWKLSLKWPSLVSEQGVGRAVLPPEPLGENLAPSSNYSSAPFFTFKGPCDYIGHTQVIQDNLPISRSSD